MRRHLLLALACFATTAAVGCDDGTSTELTNGTGKLRHPTPVPGSPEDHDTDPTVGEHDPDNYNPNAATTPNAPVGPGTSNAQFALAVGNATPTVGLGDSTSIDITVQPSGGFTGTVDVTVSGLPPGASADPLQLTGGGPGKLVIKTLVTTVTTPPSQSTPLVISGRSGTLSATANANFKVAPKVQLTIPMNIDALRAAGTQFRDEWGPAFGENQQALQTQQGNGIVVTVFNADSKAHIIHGSNGFAHGDTANPIQPNAFELNGGNPRTRTLNPGTNGVGYPHDGGNGQGASFHIKVDAVN